MSPPPPRSRPDLQVEIRRPPTRFAAEHQGTSSSADTTTKPWRQTNKQNPQFSAASNPAAISPRAAGRPVTQGPGPAAGPGPSPHPTSRVHRQQPSRTPSTVPSPGRKVCARAGQEADARKTGDRRHRSAPQIKPPRHLPPEVCGTPFQGSATPWRASSATTPWPRGAGPAVRRRRRRRRWTGRRNADRAGGR